MLRPLRARFASASYRSRLGRNLTLSSRRALISVAMCFSAGATACPVCGQPGEQGSGAYLAMTIVMSLLPLTAIGGLAWWVARQMRE